MEVCDYLEELILTLSSAHKLAAQSIRNAQHKYKELYDERARPRFPQEDSGRQRKLSRPWHGPYRIVEVNYPDGTVIATSLFP